MPHRVNFVEGWGIPKPDVDSSVAQRILRAGIGHGRVPICDRAHRLHGRYVGAGGRSASHGALRWFTTSSRTFANPDRIISKIKSQAVFFEAPPAKADEKVDTSALPSDFLVGYAPGQPAEILPAGEAKLVKAGSDIVFEVHYTPNGKAGDGPNEAGLGIRQRAAQEKRADACRRSMALSKFLLAIPTTAWMLPLKLRKEVIAGLDSSTHARAGKGF